MCSLYFLPFAYIIIREESKKIIQNFYQKRFQQIYFLPLSIISVQVVRIGRYITSYMNEVRIYTQ